MNKRLILKILVTLAVLIFIAFTPFFRASNEEIDYKKMGAIEALNKKTEVKNQAKSYKEKKDTATEEFNTKLSSLDSANLSTEEWFKQYKILLEEYSEYVDTPKTIYDEYTEQELDLLFRVVQAEIGHGYSFGQKANIVSVIFNRIESDMFGDDINSVLIPHQFSTISNGAIYSVEVEEKTILACEYVYIFGDTTGGALFFDSRGRLNYTRIGYDGAHYLYTKSK